MCAESAAPISQMFSCNQLHTADFVLKTQFCQVLSPQGVRSLYDSPYADFQFKLLGSYCDSHPTSLLMAEQKLKCITRNESRFKLNPFLGKRSVLPVFCALLHFSHSIQIRTVSFQLLFKGQIIKKCLFGVFNFFQKTNEMSHSSKNEFICSFFGRIHDLTICFRN